MTQPELTPKELDVLSRKVRSAASVRLNLENQPLIPSVLDRMTETAAQAFAISTADPELYKQHVFPTRPAQLPAIDRFRFVLRSPEPILQEVPTKEDVVAKISQLIEAAGSITDELYTPFMSPEGQILITQYIQEKIRQIREAINTSMETGEPNPEFYIFSQSSRAEIVNSVTRAFLYPNATPVNKPDDFDSGNCDYHLNTSFRRGDKGYVAAVAGPYIFFISDFGTYGWIDQDYVAETEETKPRQMPNEMFYTGGKPLFFTTEGVNHVLLPGDTIYQRNQTYMIKVCGEEGEVMYHQIPDLDQSNASSKLDFSHPQDLQKAVDFLSNLEMPYMWSVFDCSEVLRRFFLMGGIQLHKFSGDIMNDLGKISPNQEHITKPDELTNLADGIYIMNLLTQNLALPKEQRSAHAFFVIKNGDDLNAFSYAFSIIGETPIGPHVCGIPTLTKSLNMGRQFVATQIAS